MNAIDAPASMRSGGVPWAGAVVGVLLAAVWIGAAIEARGVVQKDLLAARHEFEEKQARATNLESLKLQLRELEFLSESLVHRLPSRFDAALVDDGLRGLANEAGVEILQATDGDERRKEFYAERDVEVQLRGPSRSIYRYLDGLARWTLTKNLRSLELSAESPTGTTLQARLRVTFYRFLDDDEVTQGAAHAAR